jgi:outer membrane autotransporter protein
VKFSFSSIVLIILCSLLPFHLAHALCNGGTTVTSTVIISASCTGSATKPLTLDTGANVIINSGVTVSNDAGSGRNGDPVSVLSSATSSTLINNGTISTGSQWAITNNGILTSLTNFGTVSSGTRRAIVNNTGGTITTLTNVGTLSGPFADITNSGTLIGTVNNLQGAGNAGGAVTFSGTLPTNYNIIINSTSVYGRLSAASGTMAFNIYGNTGTTLVSDVAASSVAAGTYTSVLQGFSSLTGITGTTGTYDSLSYSLVAHGSVAGDWNLVFVSATDITSGMTGSTDNLGSSLNPRFDGGILRVASAGTIARALTITTNNGTIDQNGLASTFSGALSDDVLGQPGKLIITNSSSGGSVTLGTTNTYTGGTEVGVGANLKIASSAALGTGPLALVGSLSIPATLSITGTTTINNVVTVSGDPVFDVSPGTTTTVTSAITDGDIAGDVVVQGGGTLELTNVNTYTGITSIASGSTLMLTGSGAITGSSAVTVIGTLKVGATPVSGTIDGDSLTPHGTVEFTTSNTPSNSIGSNFSLAAINIDDGATLSSAYDVNASTITIGQGTSGTLTHTAGIVDGNLALAEGSTYNYNGGTYIGAIDGTGGQFGTVAVNHDYTSTAAIGSTNGIAALNIGTGTTLTLGGNTKATATTVNGILDTGGAGRTVTGSLVGASSGSIDIRGNITEVSGNFTTASGHTLDVTLNSATANDSGKLNVGGTVTIADGTNLNIALPAGILNSTGSREYTILTGTNADVGILTIGNTGSMYVTATDVSTAGNRIIELTRLGYDSFADTTNNARVGETLNNLTTGAGGNLGIFVTRLQGTTTAAQTNQALHEVVPQSDNGIPNTTASITNTLADIVQARLVTLRNGEEGSGIAAGEGGSTQDVWVQGFGTVASQDNQGSVFGYRVRTAGIGLGFDKQLDIFDGGYAGISASHSSSTIDSKDDLKETTIESYQANLYATKQYTNNWYSNAMLGFGYHQYDTSRMVTSPVSEAIGDFEGQSYLVRMGGGRSIGLGSHFVLMPNVALTYTYGAFEDYSETGAGTLNLNVTQDSTQQLEAKIGSGIAYNVITRNGTVLRPAIHAAWLYGLVEGVQSNTSTFTGGGAAFTTQGLHPERNMFNLGADIAMLSVRGLDILVNYECDKRSSYIAHSGEIRMRYNF